MNAIEMIAGLPGAEIVQQGLADLEARRRTVASSLVRIGHGRLKRAGLISWEVDATLPEAELELYRLLRQEGGDAYSRYNALVRELISFEQALDRSLSSRRRTASRRAVGS